MSKSEPLADQQQHLDIEHSSGNVAEPANARAQLEQQLQQSSISTEAPPLAATDDASDHQEGNISPVIDTTIESPQDISDPTPPPAHEQEEEVADEYLLKEIDWIDPNTGAEKRVKIITQNKNGPCPLVAIGNVLLLRGDIQISPFDRPSVTFEYIASQLGNYLLSRSPSVPKSSILEEEPSSGQEGSRPSVGIGRQQTADYVMDYRYNLDSALTIIPNLRSGLDINVYFNSIYGFEPTAELALFDLFHVDLVHGWVVDAEDKETHRIVVERCGSYNAAVECVISSDIASRDNNSKLSEEDKTDLVHAGLVVSQFLEANATQLTYHGLQLLMDSIPRGKLSVLFRNNHASISFYTLYKHPDMELLYTLVTDSGFVFERALVWESLQDVDQSMAAFYDSWFCPSHDTSHHLDYADGGGRGGGGGEGGSDDHPHQHSSENSNDCQDEDLTYALALSLKQAQLHEATTNHRHLPGQSRRKKKATSCIIS